MKETFKPIHFGLHEHVFHHLMKSQNSYFSHKTDFYALQSQFCTYLKSAFTYMYVSAQGYSETPNRVRCIIYYENLQRRTLRMMQFLRELLNYIQTSAANKYMYLFCFNPIRPGVFLWDICSKQNIPRCDAAKRGVPSGAILFA